MRSSFNKAQIVSEDADEFDFTYGPDDERKKTILQNNSLIQSTRYFSGDYEKTIAGSNVTEVHYISGGSGLAALYVIENGNGTMYYPYTDYLGSILTVTDDQGNPVAEQSFDAWGRNRNPDDWTDQNIPSVPSWLYRGYTGHEHNKEFALINMNGRMYDPVVGRMLSADNNLQLPEYSQNYNRYTYALNNPLKFTDPTGNDWYYDAEGIAKWDKDLTEENFADKIKNGKYIGQTYLHIFDDGHAEFGDQKGELLPLKMLEATDISASQSNNESTATDKNAFVQSGAGYEDYNYNEATGNYESQNQIEWKKTGKEMSDFADFADDLIINTTMTMATWELGGSVGLKWASKYFSKPASSIFSYITPHITKDLVARGWTKELIHLAVNKSFTTRVALDKTTGGIWEEATAFYLKKGKGWYVVRNNISGKIVQISDRTKPWFPDQTIINPYIPK